MSSILGASKYQVSNAPLNKSTSQQMYSFPQSKRFDESLNRSVCDKIYNLPDIRNQRAASIGYGSQSDLSRSNLVTPAPNQYQIKNSFDKDEKQYNSITFGMSRQRTKTNDMFSRSREKSPGPGSYDYDRFRQSGNISFSIRQQLPSPDSQYTNMYSPGPGAYNNPLQTNKNGKHYVNRFQSSQTTVFTNSGRETTLQKINAPGPGSYYLKSTINPSERVFISQYKNPVGMKWGQSLRAGIVDGYKRIPGPGQYNLPLEFGYLNPAPFNRQR